MLGKKDPIVVERYENEKKFQKDAKRKLKDGYEPQSVVQDDRGRGCMRWGCLGIFAALLPSRKEYVVTYRLTE